MPRGIPKKKSELGDESPMEEVVPEETASEVKPEEVVVTEVAPEIVAPEVKTEPIESVETPVVSLMDSLVGNKLLYGKAVVSCEQFGGFYKFVDADGETFFKAEVELSDILK